MNYDLKKQESYKRGKKENKIILIILKYLSK